MRFALRSSWPNAVVPETAVATPPNTSASLPLPCPPWRSASVIRSPAAPGARSPSTSRTTRVNVSWSSAVASPTSVISAGTIVSANWNASARAWLNPSAARKRSNASTSSLRRPVSRSVWSASSPSSPRVEGTEVAVLIGREASRIGCADAGTPRSRHRPRLERRAGARPRHAGPGPVDRAARAAPLAARHPRASSPRRSRRPSRCPCRRSRCRSTTSSPTCAS